MKDEAKQTDSIIVQRRTVISSHMRKPCTVVDREVTPWP